MQKTCSTCKTPFEVTEKDIALYAKLTLSSPTLCPICRVKRRMAYRNDRSFYVRKCDRSKETFISIYPEKTPFPVYKPSEWYKDDWDPREFGQEIDFNKPFFEQWNKLKNKVPRLGIDIVHCENSEYCNYCGDDKNCYLDIAGEANEDCYFNLFTKFSKDCTDNTFVYKSELCYESLFCYTCHNVRFTIHAESCADCAFCFDIKSCNNCLFCNNIRHKKYHIFNKPYSKEDYEKFLADLSLNSHTQNLENIEKWKKEVIAKAIHRDMYNTLAEDCTGDAIKNSKNCQESYNIVNCWDCKFLYDVLDAKDCYDLNYSLYKPEVACELISTLNMRYSACNMASHYCHNTFYCDQCNNSDNLFGCIALNRSHYCILNKQYSEKDFKTLAAKLIAHMRKTGEWGEFFPAKYATNGYNETVAQEYYPLTKEEAFKENFIWADKDKRNFHAQSYQIPDSINQVPDSITNEILTCETCNKNFKIIPQELKFYKRQTISVPRTCPDCRHFVRNEFRNPRELNKTSCTKCGMDIITTYPASSLPALLYCEKCYLENVY